MRLILASGSREGQAVALDDGRLTIGRDDNNDLQITDEKVSRHHAEISRENGGSAVLRDLGSRNGTFVDEVRLDEPRVLRGGEELRLARTRCASRPTSASTPASSALQAASAGLAGC